MLKDIIAIDAATNLPKRKLVLDIGLINKVYPVLFSKSLVRESPPNIMTLTRVGVRMKFTKI